MQRVLSSVLRKLGLVAGVTQGVAVASESQFQLPGIAVEELFPGISENEVVLPVGQIVRQRSMVLPLCDLLILAGICQSMRPSMVFEIGTFTGSTTLVIALNTPDAAEIFTLDLAPGDPLLSGGPSFTAGSQFAGCPSARKITQLYGRSEDFDYSSYLGKMDLVFVDAVHSYDAVKRDSQTALQLVRPGGVIVWDDYRWLPEHRECCGVSEALHELVDSFPINQLSATRLAVCVKPLAD